MARMRDIRAVFAAGLDVFRSEPDTDRGGLHDVELHGLDADFRYDRATLAPASVAVNAPR